MNYFKTYSKTFALAIQYVTNKRFYKFDTDNGTLYSFEISENDKDRFYEKVKKLEDLRFNMKSPLL